MNPKIALGATAAAVATGVAVDRIFDSRIDAIHEKNRPKKEWIDAANDHFADAFRGGVTPEEMTEVAAYIRDHEMPEGIDAYVNSYGVMFGRAYDDDQREIGNLAIPSAMAVVGGGAMVLVGGVHALMRGGATGVPGSFGAATALVGAGMLGGYFGSKILRD